jgi:hypothetical protein
MEAPAVELARMARALAPRPLIGDVGSGNSDVPPDPRSGSHPDVLGALARIEPLAVHGCCSCNLGAVNVNLVDTLSVSKDLGIPETGAVAEGGWTERNCSSLLLSGFGWT